MTAEQQRVREAYEQFQVANGMSKMVCDSCGDTEFTNHPETQHGRDHGSRGYIEDGELKIDQCDGSWKMANPSPMVEMVDRVRDSEEFEHDVKFLLTKVEFEDGVVSQQVRIVRDDGTDCVMTLRELQATVEAAELDTLSRKIAAWEKDDGQIDMSHLEGFMRGEA